MANNNNIVSQATLNLCGDLDRQYQELLNTSGQLINKLSEVSRKLSQQTLSYRELSQAITEYKKLETDTLSLQKQEGEILQELQKIRQQVIQSTSQQVKESENLRKEIQKTNEAKKEDKKLSDEQNRALKDLTGVIEVVNPKLGGLLKKLEGITPVKEIWIKINEKLVKSLNITARTATLLQGALVGMLAYGVIILIEKYQKWQEEQQKINRLQKEMTQIESEATKAISRQKTEIQTLLNVAQDYSKSIETRQTAIKRLNELMPSYNGYIDKEGRLIDNSEAAMKKYLDTLYKVEKAKLLVNKIVDTEDQISQLSKEGLTNLTNGQVLWINFVKTLSKSEGAKVENDIFSRKMQVWRTEYNLLNGEVDNYKKELHTLFESPDLLESLFGNLSGNPNDSISLAPVDIEEEAWKELSLFRINQQAETNKQIALDNEKSYEERQKALTAFIQKQEESIKTAAQYQLEETDLTESQKLLIREKANTELIKLEQEGIQMLETIQREYLENQIEELEKKTEENKNLLQDRQSGQLKELAESYAAQEIKQEEYETKKIEIAREYANQLFEAELQALSERLELENLRPEEQEKIEKKIAELKLQYSQEVNRQIIEDAEKQAAEKQKIEEKQLQAEKELADKRKELYEELGTFISALYSGIFERKIRELDEELEALQEYYDEKLQMIEEQEEAGLITAEYANEQKKQLQEEQQAREEELQEKKKEIQLRQAKMEKAQAVLTTAINTAAGIVKLWVQPGFPAAIPLAATLGAIGATQMATILAQPLPQYRTGTGNHPGGPAIVGDGGRHELAILPDGTFFKTPAVPTLMNLPAQTMVMPDYNLALASAFQPLDNNPVQSQTVVVMDNKKQLHLLENSNKLSKEILVNQKKTRLNSMYSSQLSTINQRLSNRKS